jgi:peroxiredoxin
MPASLILSLSITCGYCDANQDAWRRLASQARSLGAQVFWVSRDTTEQMAEFAWGAGGDVVIADPTYWTHVQLKLKLVPQTVVVDGRGQVSAVRAGVLDEGAERDLIAAIERAASAISR